MMGYRHHIKGIYIPHVETSLDAARGLMQSSHTTYNNNGSKEPVSFLDCERGSYPYGIYYIYINPNLFKKPCVSKKIKRNPLVIPAPPFLLPYLILDSGLPRLPLPHLHIFTFSTSSFCVLLSSFWILKFSLIIPTSGHGFPVSNELATWISALTPLRPFFSLLWHYGEYVSLPLDG